MKAVLLRKRNAYAKKPKRFRRALYEKNFCAEPAKPTGGQTGEFTTWIKKDPLQRPVQSMDLSPDGKLLAVQYAGGEVRLWDVEKKRDLRTAAINDAAVCLKASLPDKDQPEPTCGNYLNGMWTSYYAPFIAVAVLTDEKKK